MKAISEETISSMPEQRQRVKFRLLGRRRSDKAKLIFIINSLIAICMVVVGYLLY
jgi:hypothetical protein